MSAHPTRRAILLAGATAAIAPRAAAADAPMRRILAIAGGSGPSQPNWIAFEEELRRLGYTDGRNIAIDHIWRAFELTPPALTEAIAAQLGAAPKSSSPAARSKPSPRQPRRRALYRSS